MTWVLATCAVMLVIGSLSCLYRMTVGPTTLNRALALDVLVTTLVAAVCLEAAMRRHSLTVPILLALAMVGFLGSVSIARFARREDERDA